MARYFLKMCPRCHTGDMAEDWHRDVACLHCGHTIYAEPPPEREELPFADLPTGHTERRAASLERRRAEAQEVKRIMRTEGCGVARAAALLGISRSWAGYLTRMGV